MIIRFSVVTVLGLLAGVASAGPGVDPSLYGKLDVSRFKRPETTHHRPVIADGQVRRTSMAPIYIHLPPGQQQHWATRCAEFAACKTPVYFVSEGWFMTVYLPAVGSRDGREQDYRDYTARDRAHERDQHDQHGHD